MTSNTTETDKDGYSNRYEDDDEDRTIDEQEQSDTDDEVTRVKDDVNTSLNELFKLYSKNVPTINNNNNIEYDEESYSSSDSEDDDEQRHNLSRVNGELLPDNDDEDDSFYEPDKIKLINVGQEYQADIQSKAEYDSSNENYDDREGPIDELLWSSCLVNERDNEYVDDYLKRVHSEYPASDDEISLQTLLNCHFNAELALKKFRQLSSKTIYSYAAWSLREIERFEEGLREYGKNFLKISIYHCPNRSVREVVHFYYQWKKGERYHLFIEEQQRINPLTSVSDMIEKFIEEQEHQLCTAAGVVNGDNPSAFLSNDYKLHAPISSNSSISFVNIHQQETSSSTTTTTTITTTATTKRSFDQIDNDDEPSTKKSSINIKTSSAETIL